MIPYRNNLDTGQAARFINSPRQCARAVPGHPPGSINRHGSNAGHSSGVPGVDARRATLPDPRLARWKLASCCQLDPSHPALVTRVDPGVEPCLIPCGPSLSLSRLPAWPVLRSPLLERPGMASALHAIHATKCYVFRLFREFGKIDKAFRIATPMRKALSILPPFCHPAGFESGRGQPLSGTQGKGKRVATFALVTTVGPQPRSARSTPGEPGRAADRQACASLPYLTDRQVVRNPHVRRPGFLVSMSTHPRTTVRCGRHAGLLLVTVLPKTLRTIPTYIVYDIVTQCFGHEPLCGAMRVPGFCEPAR